MTDLMKSRLISVAEATAYLLGAGVIAAFSDVVSDTDLIAMLGLYMAISIRRDIKRIMGVDLDGEAK